MLSTKHGTSRRVIVRLGVVGVVVAVLAAGCSQSEEGTSDGSESVASTSQTSLSSSVPSSLSPVVPSSPGAEITTTTTTQMPVEEATIATTSLPPAEENVPLLEGAFVDDALSEEAVRLIEAGIDACADLYEFRCAEVMEAACVNLRVALGSKLERGDDVSETEVSELIDARRQICNLAKIAHFWELDSVLSARYREEYYSQNPGFHSFRDDFFWSARTIGFPRNPLLDVDLDTVPREMESFDKFAARTGWAEYLDGAVKLRLLRLVYDMGVEIVSAIGTLTPRSGDLSNRILSAQNVSWADIKCWDEYVARQSLSGIFINWYSVKIIKIAVNKCISVLCSYKNDIFACHLGDITIDKSHYDSNVERVVLEIDVMDNFEISKSSLFWKIIKHICSTEVVDIVDPLNDYCRRAASNICQVLEEDDSRSLSIMFRAKYVFCSIGADVTRLQYSNAIDRCHQQLETLLTTINWFSVLNNSCNDASEECVKFWQGRLYLQDYYSYYGRLEYIEKCHLFERFYVTEVFWKNIPLLCFDDNNLQLLFIESECYDFIQRFCDNDLEWEFHPAYQNLPRRTDYGLRIALCNKILYTQNQISIASSSSNPYHIPYESQKIPVFTFSYPTLSILARETSTELSEANIDSISSANTECLSLGLEKSECVVKLWKSCFDLISSKARYESYESEVFRSKAYICRAASIAELIRMASVLSSSFPKDHLDGNFNQLYGYIADEAAGILPIDETGKAHPNLNPEYFRSEAMEALMSLATSIAQLAQPYLRLPATNQQSNV